MIGAPHKGQRGNFAMANAIAITVEICIIVDDVASDRKVLVTDILGFGNNLHACYLSTKHGQRVMGLSEIFSFAQALEMDACELFNQAYKAAAAREGRVKRPRPGAMKSKSYIQQGKK